ncbi:hypothetical protein Leucomu_11220 [Leucobacter muris]|uniref:Uncharacterized protein n=1 Tax=Leucobacter muris TaxID=1935379 RepID=A0ABX5QH47_9MICO|nr:hypothetical protein [Leucobacter muris]QAB18409.1 hypothetical protein Leucomu_11220 [Leucobacter muris]
MASRTCTTVKPGRCVQPGKPRAMTHVCTRFPNHSVAWHRCDCGHVWPTTKTTTDTTNDRGARRRDRKETP